MVAFLAPQYLARERKKWAFLRNGKSRRNSTKSLMGSWIIFEIMYHVGRRKTTKLNLYHVTKFSVYSDQLAKIPQHWWNESRHSKSNVRKSNSIELNPWIEFDRVRFSNVRFTMPGIENSMEAAKIGLGLRLQSQTTLTSPTRPQPQHNSHNHHNSRNPHNFLYHNIFIFFSGYFSNPIIFGANFTSRKFYQWRYVNWPKRRGSFGLA